jgi:glycosyltransferase involved in cell wall biosynthesis
MRGSPRVVIGAILFNHASEFREALESILAQTFEDFAIVLVDDQSTDETPAIAREYEALDPRVSYVVNDRRLGMVANSVRAFELAREKYPDAEYFAWASDHDVWHPRWLQQLVETLDTWPEVVLAYPLNRRIGRAGEVLARKPWAFDTFGIADPWTRVTRSIRHMSAGNMVYGLYRVELLARAGVYRHILVPDRLLMTELAIYGQFKQVPQVLWFRRWYGRIFSLGRQRANFFPGRRPLYMYAPWWIAHGVSLFATFAIDGRGLPAVSRVAGGVIAMRYLAFSGLFHLWQSLRAVRQDLLERAEVVRPYERHARLVWREIRRRGAWDWTRSHVKPYIGWKAQRKAAARMKKGLRNLAFQAVRRPGLAMIRGVRRIPLVRNRVIPSLLKQELDQIPAAPVVAEVNREMAKIRKHTVPIIIGPWLSEVGYELLYWIPFLNWAVKAYGLQQRRLIVISRGGAKPWYQHLGAEYIDVFDLYGVDEYRRKNEERWAELGHQKQSEISGMDRELIARATQKLGLREPVDLLHPSLMYRLLRFYWFEKAGVGLLTKHTDYRRLAPVDTVRWSRDLPAEYVAARFYFRPSFPDTPENRRFAADVIRALSREVPVVLLNTGFNVDDHEDLQVPGGMGIHRVDHLMTPARNLEVQTEIISRARAFVGTYGGLAYLGPYYGVPSIGFYANETELVPVHLDVGWRLGRAMNAPVATVDARAADLLRLVLGIGSRRSPVEDAPMAVGGSVLNK